MDKATFIGFLLGITTVVGAIVLGGESAQFLYPPALLIVFGGTLAGTLIKFSLAQVGNSLKVAFMAFRLPAEHPRELIERSKEVATVARKNGLLALEDEEAPNDFYRKGLQMLVDGMDPETVQRALREELDHAWERHEIGQRVFRSIGEQAPAFGMIGTLVGLVQMLGNLENPEAVGPGMAVALLTTLYGAVFAQLVAIPIADNLEQRAETEYTNHSLIMEAIGLVQQGANTHLMDELLGAYLPGRDRRKDDEAEGREGRP
ncbi:MAG: MotA/TolQ/ExbB proton channel family protein [Thiohalospira sp.]